MFAKCGNKWTVNSGYYLHELKRSKPVPLRWYPQAT